MPAGEGDPVDAPQINAEARTLNVGGVDTTVQVLGKGDPVLYLHGLGAAGVMLPIHAALAASRTVYAPHHPGFGQSSLPDWFDDFDDVVLHYAGLLDALGVGKVTLVGHSFGGWVAAELAAFFPERVEKLVLISAGGLRVPNAPATDINVLGPDQIVMRSFHNPQVAMAVMGDVSNPAVLFGKIMQDYTERSVLARLSWNPGHDPKLLRRLARLKAPTLVVWGANDQIIPPAHGEAYRDAIQGARLSMVADCGHVPVVEQAVSTAALVADFVATGGGR